MNTTLMDATLNKYPIYFFFHFIGIFFYVHLCSFNNVSVYVVSKEKSIYFFPDTES